MPPKPPAKPAEVQNELQDTLMQATESELADSVTVQSQATTLNSLEMQPEMPEPEKSDSTSKSEQLDTQAEPQQCDLPLDEMEDLDEDSILGFAEDGIAELMEDFQEDMFAES